MPGNELNIKSTKQILQELLDAEFYTGDKKWVSADSLIEFSNKNEGRSLASALFKLRKELKDE